MAQPEHDKEDEHSESKAEPSPGRFPKTPWTMLMAVRDGSDTELARQALASICESYWKPIYSFIRWSGRDAEDAEDITQEVFSTLLSTEALARVDQEKGRLRSFLLGVAKKELSRDRRRSTAEKRGGKDAPVHINFEEAETLLGVGDSGEGSPEKEFNRKWAHSLLADVFKELAQEYEKRGKKELFETMSGYISIDEEHTPYVELAEKTGMKEGAIRIAVYRIRQRYRELLHRHIGGTVERPEHVDEEMAYLFQVLR